MVKMVKYICEICSAKGEEEVHILPLNWEQWSGDYLCAKCSDDFRQALKRFQKGASE